MLSHVLQMLKKPKIIINRTLKMGQTTCFWIMRTLSKVCLRNLSGTLVVKYPDSFICFILCSTSLPINRVRTLFWTKIQGLSKDIHVGHNSNFQGLYALKIPWIRMLHDLRRSRFGQFFISSSTTRIEGQTVEIKLQFQIQTAVPYSLPMPPPWQKTFQTTAWNPAQRWGLYLNSSKRFFIEKQLENSSCTKKAKSLFMRSRSSFS